MIEPLEITPKDAELLAQRREIQQDVDDVIIFGRVRTEEEREYRWRSKSARIASLRSSRVLRRLDGRTRID
jgi:hypothetical protein